MSYITRMLRARYTYIGVTSLAGLPSSFSHHNIYIILASLNQDQKMLTIPANH